jgi:hypothetical protein
MAQRYTDGRVPPRRFRSAFEDMEERMREEIARSMGVPPHAINPEDVRRAYSGAFASAGRVPPRRTADPYAEFMRRDTGRDDETWYDPRPATGVRVGTFRIKTLVRTASSAYIRTSEVPLYVDAKCHKEELTVVAHHGGCEVLAAAATDPRDTLRSKRTAWFVPGSRWEDRP